VGTAGLGRGWFDPDKKTKAIGVNKKHGIHNMARQLPKSPDQWLTEIRLAWKDARETKSFAHMTGTNVTDADLFHLAPLVCLKLRGREMTGKEADKVTKGALANYVVNTGPDAKVQGLDSNPKMAFALCYVAAHLILGLVNDGRFRFVVQHLAVMHRKLGCGRQLECAGLVQRRLHTPGCVRPSVAEPDHDGGDQNERQPGLARDSGAQVSHVITLCKWCAD
jgi:hypothetical protein